MLEDIVLEGDVLLEEDTVLEEDAVLEVEVIVDESAVLELEGSTLDVEEAEAVAGLTVPTIPCIIEIVVAGLLTIK